MIEYTDRLQPRKPTRSEMDELTASIQEQDGIDYETSKDLVENSAYIAVFDHYATDCPDYAGKLLMVIWGGSPSMHEVYTWDEDGHIRYIENS